MEKQDIERLIEEELNEEAIINKFIELGREKGYMYSSVRFSNIQIKPDKIVINILAEQK